ncbi:zinc-binding alcohol dehydrogenase family protein [Subtercola endophyticus]|uniref:zinc-binding alcohol dehydrogenase family protein n=1 Tax=Subtercola endophyticus TaxID=2895559 RepID=UPI001E4DBEED|nr:zinc-binding alcohol dehydrogenase family protein [Subtercola endophyticus]UFS59684.1 zinc-binding alcohol dehydrogenase family protein [Subtercola endophyticus]
MPTNIAAWLDARHADLVVRTAPYPTPGAGEIVVRNRAIAVNPLDAIKQSTGDLMYRWMPYPSILGEDVAGEVVELGPGVTRFGVGDRVLAYAVGMEKGRDHAAEGGFQLHTVVRESLTAPLPDSMPFEEAVVLPLAVSTAASALFQQDQLGLRHPVAGSAGHGSSTGPAAATASAPLTGANTTGSAAATGASATLSTTSGAAATGQTVVVWGGSTSVGSNAIQLAAAAGYDVVTTASPHNHDALRRLGAAAVFDYASPTVVRDLIAAIDGATVAGIFAVGTGSAEHAVTIAIATGAKRVSLATPSVSLDGLPRRRGPSIALARVGAALVASNVALELRCRRHGIRAKFVWGSTLMNNEVGPMLWQQFLPAALADGRYVAAPAAEVVGSGLASVQPALDALRRGVSARKLVVTL